MRNGLKRIRAYGRQLLAAALSSCLLLAVNVAAAAPAAYTDISSFVVALPADPTTLNFDSTTANSLITSGAAIGGIGFSYNFDNATLKVSAGVSNGYSTTSGAHFLGTDDADILQDGDAINLTFAPARSIGLYVISNDPMVDHDVVLTAGGSSVGLIAADVQAMLADGSKVYFLGISDPDGAFSNAYLTTAGNGAFLFNVDDIIKVAAADTDGDTVPDAFDNCPAVPNGAGQLDPDDAGIAQRNTDGDAQGDACDDDDDNDQLTDLDEAGLGTSRINADTDSDGVDDGTEVANGSNPLVPDNCDIDSTVGPSSGDLLLLQRHLTGTVTLGSEQQSACDMHPDAQLNISDLLRLEQMLVR